MNPNVYASRKGKPKMDAQSALLKFCDALGVKPVRKDLHATIDEELKKCYLNSYQAARCLRLGMGINAQESEIDGRGNYKDYIYPDTLDGLVMLACIARSFTPEDNQAMEKAYNNRPYGTKIEAVAADMLIAKCKEMRNQFPPASPSR